MHLISSDHASVPKKQENLPILSWAKNWCLMHNHTRLFIMRGEFLITLNITLFVQRNINTLSKYHTWAVVKNHTSNDFMALIDTKGMDEFDMYHARCRGNTKLNMHEHTCSEYSGFIKYVFENLLQNKLTSPKVGNLFLTMHNHSLFSDGVAVSTFEHNIFAKKIQSSYRDIDISFWKGIFHIKSIHGAWISAWAYPANFDSNCTKQHMSLISGKYSCNCRDLCCFECDSYYVPTLTIYSWWRNNFEFFLPMHLRFYFDFWKADRLFLNIGVLSNTEEKKISMYLDKLCGPAIFTEKQPAVTADAVLIKRSCTNKAEIWTLVYNTSLFSLKMIEQKKISMCKLFLKHYDTTRKSLYVDHDEFYVPAFADVRGLLNRDTFNSHYVDVKTVANNRDWSMPFEWVDQPYFYRLRALQKKNVKLEYPAYHWDGTQIFSACSRKSHQGPFKEHDTLKQCGKKGSKQYLQCLRNYNIVYHFSVHSEEYFKTQKHFDSTCVENAEKNIFCTLSPHQLKIKQDFKTFEITKNDPFLVFEDDFIRPYVDLSKYL